MSLPDIIAQHMERRHQQPVSVDTLFSQNKLASFSQYSGLLRQLNTLLQQQLPPALWPFCQIANINTGRAVILCTSAACATRLKMQRAHILDNFRQKILPDLAGIDIEVSPDIKFPQNTTRPDLQPARQLSPEAAQHLRELADHTDGVLQQALLKLASRIKT